MHILIYFSIFYAIPMRRKIHVKSSDGVLDWIEVSKLPVLAPYPPIKTRFVIKLEARSKVQGHLSSNEVDYGVI